MPVLYNCKHSGDQYRISKFNNDFEVEASYLCDLSACECPAGHRPTCRHRQMLPKFIHRNYVGTEFFFDYDRGGWVQGWKEESLEENLRKSNEQLITEAKPLSFASEALPIQPEIEPSSILGGFPDWCLINECITPNDCILFGCAHEYGTPQSSLASAGLGQASDPVPSAITTKQLDQAQFGRTLHQRPSPSPPLSTTIRRRV